jgi:hypothetical protein
MLNVAAGRPRHPSARPRRAPGRPPRCADLGRSGLPGRDRAPDPGFARRRPRRCRPAGLLGVRPERCPSAPVRPWREGLPGMRGQEQQEAVRPLRPHRTHLRPSRRGRDLLLLLPRRPADRSGVRRLRQGPDACHPQRRRRSALPGLLDAARPHLRLLRHRRPGQGQGRGRCALPAVLPAASATPAGLRKVREDPGDLPAGHRRQPRPLRELQRPEPPNARSVTRSSPARTTPSTASSAGPAAPANRARARSAARPGASTRTGHSAPSARPATSVSWIIPASAIVAEAASR